MQRSITNTLIAAFLTFLIFIPNSWAKDNQFKSFERVVEKNTLRCGYVNYYPFFRKDPNTGNFEGIFYEITEAVGKELQIEIEWVEETAFETMYLALNQGRFDAVCSGLWDLPQHSKWGSFSDPMFFSVIYPYTRAGDTRFDGDIQKANTPDYKIATIDGEMAAIIAHDDLPKAKTISSPNLTEVSKVLLDVTSKKADLTFVEIAVAKEYLKHNPDSLRRVQDVPPTRAFANMIMVPKGDYKLLEMINTAQRALVLKDKVNTIIDKYEPYPNSFLRLNPPYLQK